MLVFDYTEEVDSIQVAGDTVVVVAEDIDSQVEGEVVLPATCFHNCRKSGCHIRLALHTWDRDTSAS